MLQVNIPEIVADLTRVFKSYEQALMNNDIAAVNAAVLEQ